jgi:RNA polymerase sigma-70 factor (ECF subfamily)
MFSVGMNSGGADAVESSAQRIADRENCWQEYIREIRMSNSVAMRRLYDASSGVLYTLALRITRNSADAEEVLLDVYQHVWKNAGKFDPARGTVWRWLILMTRSRALDRLRSGGSRREREDLTDCQDIRSSGPLPDEATLLNEQQKFVRHAVSSLPPEQRSALELAYFSGFTHSEIASRLGVPLGTIKTRIRMAMDKLRVALQVLDPRTAGPAA